jgi:hypothetical protein
MVAPAIKPSIHRTFRSSKFPKMFELSWINTAWRRRRFALRLSRLRSES